MQNNQLSTIQSHPKFIDQQLRLSNARLSNSKANSLPLSKNLNDLYHILAHKNRDIHEKRLQNFMVKNPQLYNRGGQMKELADIIKQEKQMSRKLRFENRNQMAYIQFARNRNEINTNEVYQTNQRLKNQVRNSKIFQKAPLKQENLLQPNSSIIDFNESPKRYSKIATLSLKDMKIQQSTPVSSYQQNPNFFTKQKKVSDQMDDKIIEYLAGLIDRKTAVIKVDLVSAQLDCTNKERIFGTFMRIMLDRVLRAKEKDLTVFDHAHQHEMSFLYEQRMKTEEKWKRYISQRSQRSQNERRSLLEIVENEKNQDENDFEMFRKCVILLLTGTAGLNDLISQLNSIQTHKNLVDEVKAFFNAQQRCYPQDYIQKNTNAHLYGVNIYYRLFVKILFDPEDLDKEELAKLNPNERKFLTYLLLKYKPNYRKSSTYKSERQARFAELIEHFKTGSKQKIEPLLNKMIEMREIDQIYQEFFNQPSDQVSHCQNMFLLDFLVSEKDFLTFSQFTQGDCIRKILEQLILVVNQADTFNSQKTCRLLVQVLKKWEPALGEKFTSDMIFNLIQEKPVLIDNEISIRLIEITLEISGQEIQSILSNPMHKR